MLEVLTSKTKEDMQVLIASLPVEGSLSKLNLLDHINGQVASLATNIAGENHSDQNIKALVADMVGKLSSINTHLEALSSNSEGIFRRWWRWIKLHIGSDRSVER